MGMIINSKGDISREAVGFYIEARAALRPVIGKMLANGLKREEASFVLRIAYQLELGDQAGWEGDEDES